jgi:hypothetical protein
MRRSNGNRNGRETGVNYSENRDKRHKQGGATSGVPRRDYRELSNRVAYDFP